MSAAFLGLGLVHALRPSNGERALHAFERMLELYREDSAIKLRPVVSLSPSGVGLGIGGAF